MNLDRLRAVAIALLAAAGVSAQTSQPPIARFIDAASPDSKLAKAALEEIAASWTDAYVPMFVDIVRLMRPSARSPAAQEDTASLDADEGDFGAVRAERRFPAVPDAGSPVRRRLLAFLADRTGQLFGDDLGRWREWMWTLPAAPHPDYAAFKGLVYGQIDSRMRSFFPSGVRSTIRLDEIDWGGVPINGIPPLRYPTVLRAPEAGYLKDSNIVFGVALNGEARAYPKRILAWHEMATDRIGGVEMTIVYSTLCGTVIPFESLVSGRSLRFGTSGLLYRSNKLMFDEQTASLWSTFEGVPVVGPLVGSGVALQMHPVVRTTWKEWRIAHPDTTVLSLNTGFRRDYSEGAAYRDYFASDRLMFRVSRTDGRLRNKAEVLVMRLTAPGGASEQVPVAIDAQFLCRHPVYSFTAAGQQLVVVTTDRGANRVYTGGVDFPQQKTSATLVDGGGGTWRMTEGALVSERDPGFQLPRIAAQRAFWFGWYAQYPNTLLIK